MEYMGYYGKTVKVLDVSREDPEKPLHLCLDQNSSYHIKSQLLSLIKSVFQSFLNFPEQQWDAKPSQNDLKWGSFQFFNSIIANKFVSP